MAQDKVCRLKAWYVGRRDRRDLEVSLSESGDYAVIAQGDWHYKDRYPMHERMSREAMVDGATMEKWLDELLEICEPDWYHHYRQPRGYIGFSFSPSYRWGIRIERASGALQRWEGEGACPTELMDAFEQLCACGMPRPPIMPECWTLRAPGSGKQDSLQHLICYEQLLERAGGLKYAETLAEDTVLLLREFIDDIKRYLRRNSKDFSLDTALDVWGIEPTLAGLRSTDVSHAPRMEMLTLYAALAEMQNAEGAAASLFRDKTLERWSERLEALPGEEELESRRLERERRKALRLAIDQALQDKISQGEEFTVREVADAVGVHANRVSSRVRSLVQRGELKSTGEGRPKRYRAA